MPSPLSFSTKAQYLGIIFVFHLIVSSQNILSYSRQLFYFPLVSLWLCHILVIWLDILATVWIPYWCPPLFLSIWLIFFKNLHAVKFTLCGVQFCGFHKCIALCIYHHDTVQNNSIIPQTSFCCCCFVVSSPLHTHSWQLLMYFLSL